MSGAELALLLLGGFRTLAGRATAELARRGYDDVRPVHEFALRAIIAGSDSASALGRATSVTKQAAAKTIAILEERDYVTREPDPADGRRMRLRVTSRATAMLREGESIFDEMQEQWAQLVGRESYAAFTDTLRTLVGEDAVRPGAPGWVADDAS